MFYGFMMRYRKDDTPFGDLAREMKTDAHLGGSIRRLHSHDEIEKYLKDRSGGSQECLSVFNSCWEAYQKEYNHPT